MQCANIEEDYGQSPSYGLNIGLPELLQFNRRSVLEMQACPC